MLPISAELQKKNAQRTQSFQLRANYLRTSVELSTSRERLPPQYGVPRNGEWKKGPSSDNPSAPKYPIRDRDSPPPPAAANKLVDAAAILKYSHAAAAAFVPGKEDDADEPSAKVLPKAEIPITLLS